MCGCDRFRGLGAMIEYQLKDYGDVHVTMVADPDYGGAHGTLKPAMELPPEYWGQVGEMAEVLSCVSICLIMILLRGESR